MTTPTYSTHSGLHVSHPSIPRTKLSHECPLRRAGTRSVTASSSLQASEDPAVTAGEVIQESKTSKMYLLFGNAAKAGARRGKVPIKTRFAFMGHIWQISLGGCACVRIRMRHTSKRRHQKPLYEISLRRGPTPVASPLQIGVLLPVCC